MGDMIEQLESRVLFAVSYPVAGTYTGTAIPHGGASVAAIIAATGTKKGGGKVAASLDLTVAENAVVTGALTLTGVGTYALGGNVDGVDVGLKLIANGTDEGTVAGVLKALDKKLIGPFTDTINGATISGELRLENTAAIKSKGSGSTSVALAPGYYPNQTPPAIGSGISSGTSPGDETGVTGGSNSGTGVVGGDSGSILG